MPTKIDRRTRHLNVFSSARGFPGGRGDARGWNWLEHYILTAYLFGFFLFICLLVHLSIYVFVCLFTYLVFVCLFIV